MRFEDDLHAINAYLYLNLHLCRVVMIRMSSAEMARRDPCNIVMMLMGF